MSQLVNSPLDCCNPDCCDDLLTVQVPGPQGPAGTPCTPCTNGVDAFTTLTAGFSMPAEGGSVTVAVVNSTWIVPGTTQNSIVFVQSAGYMQVTAVSDSTHATLKNIAVAASGIYPANAAPTTAIPNGSKVSPGGVQGPAGVTPAGAALVLNQLGDAGFVAATMRTNLGLGSASQLTAAQVFQVANNLSEGVAATKRTNLGLGSMATQAAGAVAITGGSIEATTLGAVTPSTAAVTTLAASGAVAFNGNVTAAAKTFLSSSAIQSLLAATTVSPNATKIRVVGNGGAVVLVNTPTITSPAADGQLLVIMGTDDANTVTFQRESALAGSKLRLGAATRALGLYDTLTLIWDAVTGYWVELAFVNNT